MHARTFGRDYADFSLQRGFLLVIGRSSVPVRTAGEVRDLNATLPSFLVSVGAIAP